MDSEAMAHLENKTLSKNHLECCGSSDHQRNFCLFCHREAGRQTGKLRLQLLSASFRKPPKKAKGCRLEAKRTRKPP